MPRPAVVLWFLLTLPPLLQAQDSTPAAPAPAAAPHRTGHWHITLGVHDNGVTIGNAARTNGVRLNAVDADLELVNGVNITLWKPLEPLSGTVNGLAVGLGPGAEEINGIAIGLAAVVAEARSRWITVGGLAAVSNGDLEGLAVSGLGTVANNDISGIAVAGLGTVANRDARWVTIAGLGTVANRNLSGIAIAGLGTVAN